MIERRFWLLVLWGMKLLLIHAQDGAWIDSALEWEAKVGEFTTDVRELS